MMMIKEWYHQTKLLAIHMDICFKELGCKERDRWEYLDQIILKILVGIFRLKYKMLNLDDIVSNKKKSSSENDDWSFRMLIIGPSGSGRTNTLLHLIDKFHPIDKMYLYAKDTDEEKYQYLINKREQVGIKNLNDPYAFIEYSNDMNDVLEDINNYDKNRDKKVLIIFEKF